MLFGSSLIREVILPFVSLRKPSLVNHFQAVRIQL